MKPVTRTVFVMLLLVAAGLGCYALREYARLAAQRAALDARVAAARAATDRAQREREAAERELATLARAAKDSEALTAAARAAIPPPSSAVTAWEGKVATLRSLLARHREWTIPEIDLLSPDEFIFFARDAELDSEDAQRKALRDFRALAKRKAVPVIREALHDYITAHGGQLPASLDELATLFKTPLPETVLKRYVLTGLAAIPVGQKEELVLYERTPVDELYDTRHVLGVSSSVQLLTNPEVYVFTRALAAYDDANPGRKPAQPAELGPYLEVPLDPPTLDRYFNTWQKDPANLGLRQTASVYRFRPLGAPREPAN